MSVWEEDGYIYAETPYDEDWRMAAKEMNGRWDPDQRVWYFDASQHEVSEIVEQVRLFFPRLR